MDRDLEALVADHGQALLRTAYLLCGDAKRAEDLVQSALLKALRRWRKVDAPVNAYAYLRRIVANEYVSWRRLRSSGERPVTHERLDGTTTDVASAVDDRDEAWRLLATLPKQQRAVLVLRLYEDMTDADIADVLGCAVGTVRSHASLGLATLRERLTSTQEVS